MELAAQHWGQNTSPKKILLLHGMGGTGALWRPIAADLEADFEILAPDQRGHGRSRVQGPATYTPLDFAADVTDTLHRSGFHPCWVVGHSMGVRTACALASLKPEWVRGLILVDLGMEGLAGGSLGENLARFISILPESFSSREEARTFMAAHCPDPSIAQYLMAVSVTTPQGVTFPFDHQALIATIEAARGVSLVPWVEQAARRGIPVLALRGEKSQVWSPETFQNDRSRFAQGLPITFEEVAGAGHGLPFEKRAQFTARLREFTA